MMKKIKQFLKKLPIVKEIWIKLGIIKSKILKKIIRKYAEKDALHKIISQKSRAYWEPRIEAVKASPDNHKIHQVPHSGRFNEDNNFIMHNSIIINPFSYYGIANLNLLHKNKGIHEPQEEYAFQEILKEIPVSGTIVELGAYWSFYSMWFHMKVEQANCYMIEPETLAWGKENFKLNGMQGDFTKAYISDKSGESIEGITTICVDEFIQKKGIEFIDILHADIQGFEYKMLLGSENLLRKKNVGYIFISTHSNEIHYQCLTHLESKGFKLVCGHDMDESFSWDGLLVFKNPTYPGIDRINISKRELGLVKDQK